MSITSTAPTGITPNASQNTAPSSPPTQPVNPTKITPTDTKTIIVSSKTLTHRFGTIGLQRPDRFNGDFGDTRY